jgi:hypothetical protein
MSLSFLMPRNPMRVPGMSCIGARIYLGKVSSLHARRHVGQRQFHCGKPPAGTQDARGQSPHSGSTQVEIRTRPANTR